MHPAVSIPAKELWAGLLDANEKRLVNIQKDGRLWLFNYTPECVYSKTWNIFTRSARGLIIDSETKNIIALPFPKFFNLSENVDQIPDEPFQVYEKLDGSLICLFWDPFGNFWRCSTRGSFSSDQAKAAQKIVNNLKFPVLNRELTYLFELVGPNNKIVVNYPEDKLVLLGIYSLEPGSLGKNLDYDFVKFSASMLDLQAAEEYHYVSIADLVHRADNELTKDEEGFVLHFPESDLRVKIKSAEYRKIHALISKLSPLSVWAAMKDMPDTLEEFRKELPEELWPDYDSINRLINEQVENVYNDIYTYHLRTQHLTDKELGLTLNSIDPAIRPFIFPFRKANGLLKDRFRDAIYRAIRPDSNRLPGYVPSSAMHRVQGELL